MAKTRHPTPGWKICRSNVTPRGGNGWPDEATAELRGAAGAHSLRAARPDPRAHIERGRGARDEGHRRPCRRGTPAGTRASFRVTPRSKRPSGPLVMPPRSTYCAPSRASRTRTRTSAPAIGWPSAPFSVPRMVAFFPYERGASGAGRRPRGASFLAAEDLGREPGHQPCAVAAVDAVERTAGLNAERRADRRVSPPASVMRRISVR